MLYFSYCKICSWHRLPVFLGRLYLQSSIKCLFASSHTTTETLQIPSMQVKTFCFVPFVNLTFDFLISVTRLGDFWTFSATKFIAKEVKMIGNFLGYFKKPHYYALAAFRATFRKNWATFYSNIWLHCFWSKWFWRFGRALKFVPRRHEIDWGRFK